MKRNFLRCMAAVTALFAASCSSLPGLEGGADYEAEGEEVEVTFSISTESAYTTRAGEVTDRADHETIGKGNNIDMLIYAVYDDDEQNTLLKQYGKGIVGFDNGASALDGMKHDGQTVVNVGDVFPEGSYKITLRLMRNKKYHIAFWAQSSKTTAFNTDDLKEVQVIYKNALNNDELRDAFCKVESFSVTPTETNRSVILTRPLAQVNVGSTKNYLDYNTSAAAVSETASLYSKISLSDVSQYINVVKDSIDAGNLIEEVEFAWNRIPALMENEERLYVDRNEDGQITQDEVFTYLSMCYVLVPKVTASTGDVSSDTAEDHYPLDVKFALSADEGSSSLPLFTSSNANANELSITGVHTYRNWRTNILLGEGNNTRIPAEPDVPNIPDNPNVPDNPNPPTPPSGGGDDDGPNTPPSGGGDDDGPNTPPDDGGDDKDPEPDLEPEPEPEPDPDPRFEITIVVDPGYNGETTKEKDKQGSEESE